MPRILSYAWLIVTGLLLAGAAFAKDEYRVYFRDKGLTQADLTPGSAAFERTLAKLSSKSIERRKKSLGVAHDWQTISEQDYSVNALYLSQLEEAGAKLLTTSNWLNFTSIECDAAAIEKIAQFLFVREIRKLSPPQAQFANAGVLAEDCGADTIVFHRGLATWQLDRINTAPMHWLGIDATGVTIAYFDTGFFWKENRALDHLNVIGEYDFVHKDSVTADDAGDSTVVFAHGHGTAVLGVAAAYLPDTVMGPAYNANIILGKTEDLRSETPREEENYAAGLEWAELLGADIASVSLGYIFFDPEFQSYTYADLNGETAISSKAAARAAQLGMLIVVAMGNDGVKPFPYLGPPADADSIISVGAIDVNDSLALFSSRGPTSDGRIKPEISAPGVQVWSYNPFSGPVPVSGTSHAAPLVSASSALIMQAHPDATAQEIRQAIMETGDRADNPDTAYGWGMLNTYAAALKIGPFIGKFTQSFVDNRLSICLGYASNKGGKRVQLVYRKGGSTSTLDLAEVSDSLYYTLDQAFLGNTGDTISYHIEAISGNDTIRLPNSAPNVAYKLVLGDTAITYASVTGNGAKRATAQVYPNPATQFVEVVSETPMIALDLMDVAGRALLTSLSTTELSKRVALQDVASGSYLLRVVYKNGEQEILQVRVVR